MKRLEKSKIDEENIKILMLKDEIVLEQLLSFKEDKRFNAAVEIVWAYNDTKTILEALDIYKNNKYQYYASLVLTDKLRNPNAISAGIALEGAKIINKSNKIYKSMYASWALINEDMIKVGIALEGAKLISESKTCSDADHILKRYTAIALLLKQLKYIVDSKTLEDINISEIEKSYQKNYK